MNDDCDLLCIHDANNDKNGVTGRQRSEKKTLFRCGQKTPSLEAERHLLLDDKHHGKVRDEGKNGSMKTLVSASLLFLGAVSTPITSSNSSISPTPTPFHFQGFFHGFRHQRDGRQQTVSNRGYSVLQLVEQESTY